MFDSVIAIVCSEELSGEGLYHMETSELICFANQLTGFHMMLVFAERRFRTDDNVVYCFKYFVNFFKLLSAMIIVVLSKSLVYCYYVVYN